MNYENELNKALKRLKDLELALNESSIVAITDSKGVIQFANDKFCKVSKYSRDELVGSKQSIVKSGYHSRQFFKKMWRTIGTGNVWKGEIKNQAKDGTYYWVDTTIVPFLDDNGKPYQYIAIRHDITKLKEYEETIRKMAYYDPLTLLPNRNLLSNWLKKHSKEYGVTITVLFLDMDRFKSINDRFGHSTGDMVLKELAKRLQNCVQKSDLIVRQGGDEFIIFLKRIDNKKEVMTIVNKIKEQFTFPFFVNGQEIVATTSIGISKVTIKESDSDYLKMIEATIRHADKAMYNAKKRSGNTHSFNLPDQNNVMN